MTSQMNGLDFLLETTTTQSVLWSSVRKPALLTVSEKFSYFSSGGNRPVPAIEVHRVDFLYGFNYFVFLFLKHILSYLNVFLNVDETHVDGKRFEKQVQK